MKISRIGIANEKLSSLNVMEFGIVVILTTEGKLPRLLFHPLRTVVTPFCLQAERKIAEIISIGLVCLVGNNLVIEDNYELESLDRELIYLSSYEVFAELGKSNSQELLALLIEWREAQISLFGEKTAVSSAHLDLSARSLRNSDSKNSEAAKVD